MPSYDATQRIAAPAGLVWKRIAAVTARPEWLPTVSRVDAFASATLAVESRFKVLQPGLRPVVWTVTELNPGHNFIWEWSGPGLQLWANHTIETTPASGSQITLEFRFTGLLAPLMALAVGEITRRYLATEAASLKAHAEAEARGEA
jgi:uncharacterized protein YndB with AHSA1/START domain